MKKTKKNEKSKSNGVNQRHRCQSPNLGEAIKKVNI